MSETDETLEIIKNEGGLLKAVETLIKRFDTLENKIDKFEKSTNIQFEAIRQGIAANSASFDR